MGEEARGKKDNKFLSLMAGDELAQWLWGTGGNRVSPVLMEMFQMLTGRYSR
jgi:hypothetical protein